MPSSAPPPDDLLARAAERRYAGHTWAAVASAVGKGERTVRRWPTLYPDRWATAVAAARKQLLADAAAESVHTLRHQLRAESDAARSKAADLLLRHTARKRPAKPKRTAGPSKLSPQLAHIAAELEGLSDADLDRLLADLDDPPADPGDGPAAEAGPAGGG